MANDPWADFIPQTSSTSSGDPWADFVQPATAEAAALVPGAPVTAGGLYRAADAGMASAAASFAGLPKLISEYGNKGVQAGSNWLVDKLGLPESLRDTKDYSQPGLIRFPTSEEAQATIQRDLYGGAAPYQPQNRAERYAQTGGEFALNAVAPGGLVRKAVNVALPAAATEAVKERGGGALAQFGAGLVGGAGAAKLGNVAERLSAGALPSIEKGVAGNLKDVAGNQYRAIEAQALAVPTTPIQRGAIADLIEYDLHAKNFRPANAEETYKILGEIKAGTPGKSSDVADLLTARRKLGNVSGEDGVAALQARNAITQVLEAKIPGIGKALETADKNYNALKVAETLSAKIQKATDQTGATNSGLNLGNKLRQGAAEIANNPNRTRYMNPIDVQALRDLAAGTGTQNTIRYLGGLLGGGGGLGATVAAGLGATSAAGAYHTGEPSWLGGAAPILAGLALKRGYNRSIARQAQGIGQGVLARSPQAQLIGGQYVAPMTLKSALGRGIPSGIYGGLPANQGILGAR